jgi:dTMP kinase
MSAGKFITLEGGEGTGKSTQSTLLSNKLRVRDIEVVQTREPGGTKGAEEIRNLLVSGNPESWTPVAEALLMSAAREDHLRRCIIPALEGGQFVICDRFIDSTWAYQGCAGGVNVDLLAMLEAQVVGKFIPDLTLVFDLDPEIGLARASGRGQDNEDRFEAKGRDYHQKIRSAFIDIAHKSPERCVIVDASTAIEDIEALIWQIVSDRFL